MRNRGDTESHPNRRFSITDQRSLMTPLLLTSAVVLALPVAALASPPAGDHQEHEMGAGPGMGGMPCEQRMLHRRGEWRTPDGEYLPPMLQCLDLSDTQRRQIREIVPAQADTQRARGEELRKAREARHNLTMSEDYSETKVKNRLRLTAGLSGRWLSSTPLVCAGSTRCLRRNSASSCRNIARPVRSNVASSPMATTIRSAETQLCVQSEEAKTC